MVQLFYYENRGQCARKILRHDGCRTKVLLFPYEGWAQPASHTYWIIKTLWWSRTRCKIVQVCGTKKTTAIGKLTTSSNGSVSVTGKFSSNIPSTGLHSSDCASSYLSHPSSSGVPPSGSPDFKLSLSTNVSNADFQMGYSMTGTLERGNRHEGQMDMTHYAMIKRKGY